MVLRERCRPNRRTPGNGKQKDSGTIGISENSRWSCRCWHSAEAPPDLYARMFRMVTTGNPRPYGVPRERRAEIMHSLCNAKIKLMAAAAIAPVQVRINLPSGEFFIANSGVKVTRIHPFSGVFLTSFQASGKGLFLAASGEISQQPVPHIATILRRYIFYKETVLTRRAPAGIFSIFCCYATRARKKKGCLTRLP